MSSNRYEEAINNKPVCEIQAMTVRLHQKMSLAVAAPKHSQTNISSNRSSDQAHAESVHIILAICRNVGTCKDTKHDSSQLGCIGSQSLCKSHCRMKSYFRKHVPSEH